MRLLDAAALVLLVTPGAAVAGNLYGSITQAGKPVAGAAVVVTCGGSTYKAQTGADGGYRVHAKETARCTLEITHQGQPAKVEIVSYNDPTRYDFELVTEGGKPALRKK
jgi:hypothetical protein